MAPSSLTPMLTVENAVPAIDIYRRPISAPTLVI
jgi:hypothetical protein